jgi:hypothetical protein
MAKLGVIRRIAKEDLTKGGDLPAWVDPFITTLNQFIDATTSALQNRLTFADNFNCKTVVLDFTSGTDQILGQSSYGRPIGVLPVSCGGKGLTEFKTRFNDQGDFVVTLTFNGGGTSTCRLILLYQ